jgi:hypothetical protein
MSAPSGSPSQRPPERKAAWGFYALVALILLALPAAYFLFLDRPPPPAVAPPKPPEPPPVVEAPKPVELRLAEVEGTVEVRQPDGTWTRAAKGDALKRSDAVRTLDGSVAVIVGGEAWEVRMEPGTEVSVDDLTASISRILLQNGMATAKVRGDAKHTFEVRAAGSDAVAKTSDGTFAVSNNGQGLVAVGTKEGEVELSGSGKVVIVRAGQQSVVRPGVGPSEPTAIPSSLLLKVKWPDRKLLKKRRLVVTGETAPGAHVEIGGRVVKANAEGRFRESIELSEGKNKVEVSAKAVGGARARSDADLQVDTRNPGFGIDRDIWKQKKK